ncbi:transglycosylase SLT domain-containing protein [Echinicola jeungdonensis]|uniref:Transglycosylase SLT domain-containing protein n=1 Tax=Echinicola jeungdonensis TaxID=709343 RepID=A0ABV5J219_9BACT|nr:lytic transglycosylase domain-containing protein [Echinicola jeungdonensis]MDN3669013.1 transglycosylase SLT domain-containing protein [Echinicola jeungdonensis]
MRKYHLIFIYGLIAIQFVLLFILIAQKNGYGGLGQKFQNQEGGRISVRPDVSLFPLPENLEFAGEEVPLDQPDILERWEREIYVNVSWESNTLLMMKRAGKYLPRIREILVENHIPKDFQYVALVESGLRNVVSPAGARGFWQFLEGTAKQYGLEVNEEVDERYHWEKATSAACQYFQDSYDRFGNWTSVAASYNMGRRGLTRRMNDQIMPDYYGLLLNEETSRYVFRVLAFKEIFENPGYYGYNIRDKDKYHLPTFRNIRVTNSIDDLAKWAREQNSTYKELKLYNPWLRTGQLTLKKGEEYEIKLPKK